METVVPVPDEKDGQDIARDERGECEGTEQFVHCCSSDRWIDARSMFESSRAVNHPHG
jgi:hypothetical protein